MKSKRPLVRLVSFVFEKIGQAKRSHLRQSAKSAVDNHVAIVTDRTDQAVCGYISRRASRATSRCTNVITS